MIKIIFLGSLGVEKTKARTGTHGLFLSVAKMGPPLLPLPGTDSGPLQGTAVNFS